MAKCKYCGITTGRGKRHEDDCDRPNKATTNATTASGGIRIDGRTPIPKLLTWQAEIEAELKRRKPADIKAVKKAIDEIDALEVRLAEAKGLAGIPF